VTSEWIPPTQANEDGEEEKWTQIIHNDCGLPIELCTCPDAPVKVVKEEKPL